jgi:hypothetical protein
MLKIPVGGVEGVVLVLRVVRWIFPFTNKIKDLRTHAVFFSFSATMNGKLFQYCFEPIG